LDVIGIAEVTSISPNQVVKTDGKIFELLENISSKMSNNQVKIRGFTEPSSPCQVSYHSARPVIQGVYEEVEHATNTIKKIIGNAEVGIVIDSILGESFLKSQVEVDKVIPYSDIPFKAITNGKLVFGKVNKVPVYVLLGTSYCNQGYSAADITFAIRLVASLGVKTLLFVSCFTACDESIGLGSLAIVKDQVLLSGRNSLFGPNEDRWGLRFPDVSELYNRKLQRDIHSIAEEVGIKSIPTILGHVTGPVFGSPAEAHFAYSVGIHALTTGIALEVLVAGHMGVSSAAVGLITTAIHSGEKLKNKEQAISLLESVIVKAVSAAQGRVNEAKEQKKE